MNDNPKKAPEGTAAVPDHLAMPASGSYRNVLGFDPDADGSLDPTKGAEA